VNDVESIAEHVACQETEGTEDDSQLMIDVVSHELAIEVDNAVAL
jgi:hypothetical protein